MHMDHFDRQLELELARMLDPVVNAPVPRRGRRRGLTVLTMVAPEVPLLVTEPVPVAFAAPVATPS